MLAQRMNWSDCCCRKNKSDNSVPSNPAAKVESWRPSLVLGSIVTTVLDVAVSILRLLLFLSTLTLTLVIWITRGLIWKENNRPVSCSLFEKIIYQLRRVSILKWTFGVKVPIELTQWMFPSMTDPQVSLPVDSTYDLWFCNPEWVQSRVDVRQVQGKFLQKKNVYSFSYFRNDG